MLRQATLDNPGGIKHKLLCIFLCRYVFCFSYSLCAAKIRNSLNESISGFLVVFLKRVTIEYSPNVKENRNKYHLFPSVIKKTSWSLRQVCGVLGSFESWPKHAWNVFFYHRINDLLNWFFRFFFFSFFSLKSSPFTNRLKENRLLYRYFPTSIFKWQWCCWK